MEYKICIVAPFPDMVREAEEVVRERTAEWKGSIEVLFGDSQAGVDAAQLAAERGTEVFISRGGTALAIASELAIPMVQLQVTALDILRAIKQAAAKSDIIGIAGFRNVVYECEMLAGLLGRSIHTITLENKDETAEKIAFMASKGVNLVIGDVNSVMLAKEMGMGGYVIKSGKDAIYNAIKEAELVAQVRHQEQERAEILRTIVDSSTDGIIAVDKTARITVFNPSACAMFGVNRAETIGRYIREIIPNTRLPEVLESGAEEIGDIQYVGHKILATKRIPIKIKNKAVGAIANFQDVTQLQHFEQTIRQKLHAQGLVAKVSLDDIIGASPVLEEVKRQVRRYTLSGSTVLIMGESGTGKEMFAQSIHKLSSREQGPFVAVNCAALPENLLESELMGYEEGAFTGAKKGGKQGLFELAHGGTIFLDEIGEISVPLQARLLRVLQEKEVMRLGGHKVIPIDVRVIAATNQHLAELVAENKFRADLYYRLNILQLNLPPLRNRREDIPLLIDYFLRKLSSPHAMIKKLTTEAVAFLQSLSWPGNIRELVNILERVLVLSDQDEIGIDEVKAIVANDLNYVSQAGLQVAKTTFTNQGNLEKVERETIEQILQEEDFNYTRAARRLGINRTTLWRKMQKTK